MAADATVSGLFLFSYAAAAEITVADANIRLYIIRLPDFNLSPAVPKTFRQPDLRHLFCKIFCSHTKWNISYPKIINLY